MRFLFVLVIFLAIFAMILEAKKNAPQEPPGRICNPSDKAKNQGCPLNTICCKAGRGGIVHACLESQTCHV